MDKMKLVRTDIILKYRNNIKKTICVNLYNYFYFNILLRT